MYTRVRGLLGSSPLARGLRYKAPAADSDDGIIPARAGFTYSLFAWRPGSADHPRSRGVYVSPVSQLKTLNGSSPLARGLLQKIVGDNEKVRIIPARAGFTLQAQAHDTAPQDHPRSRGVYTSGSFVFRAFNGSSPLARGLRRISQPTPITSRIIPARAGFTPDADGPGERL